MRHKSLIYLALHVVLLKGVAPDEVVKTTLTLMAGLAAVLAGVYAYRKQRLSEADGRRADADQTRADREQLTQRYSTAAEQLGHDKAAVRLAGVFAMSRLADDWPKQRQECIDVLCAYLRMPADLVPAGIALSEREVRATIVRTIADHLRDQSAVRWGECNFDFKGAALHDADFQFVTFSGRTNFDGARFSGNAWFPKVTFSGGFTNFHEATFAGDTSFLGATFCGQLISFLGAKFSGDAEFYGTTFSGEVSFDGATFSRQSTHFDRATFSGKRTSFDIVTFSGANTRFDRATFCGENTSFVAAKFSGVTSADEATAKASFIGETVDWGPITPRALPSPATEAQ